MGLKFFGGFIEIAMLRLYNELVTNSNMQLYKRRLTLQSNKLLTSQVQYSGVDVQTFKTISGSRIVFFIAITEITGSLNVLISNGSFENQEFRVLEDVEYTAVGSYTLAYTDIHRLFSLVITGSNVTYSISVTITNNSSTASIENPHTITEVVNSSTTYIGKTRTSDEDHDEPHWQIQRILTIGNTTTQSFANDGIYNNKWSERTSLFAANDISNIYSTSFNGINQGVNFGNSFTSMDVGSQWSMSFWVWVDNYASQRCIYSKTTNDGNVYGFSIQITTSGNIFLQARTTGFLINHTGTNVVPTQQWFHLAITYAGGNNFNGIRVYTDGVLDSSGASGAMGTTLHLGQNALLGKRNTAFPFSGKLDEVSFWDKALSLAEVNAVKNAINLSTLSFGDTLIHHWRMGDGDAHPWMLDNVGTTNGLMENMNSSNFTTDVA